MQVYQSAYLTLEVVPENHMIKLTWLPETITMTDDIFKAELTKYAEIVEQYHPHFLLIDTSAFAMTVVPETQEWVQNNIHPRSLKAGIQKIAYVTSKDFFAKISIEQTMEDSILMSITKYFDNRQDAISWLLEK